MGEPLKMICYVGDEDVIAEAKALLIAKLRQANKLQGGGLNMEPFEVLRDILRSGRFPSVGGAPQVVKVYEHMNAAPFGVYWPNRDGGQVCAFGRPLMPYEKVPWGVIDPDDAARPPAR